MWMAVCTLTSLWSLPAVQDLRIDFQFDRAAFTFNALPFKIPYPVPFKLLGDETKVRVQLCQKPQELPPQSRLTVLCTST